MEVTRWLADKSALVRLSATPDRDDWYSRLERGLVHTCTVTLLEMGFSARNGNDLSEYTSKPPITLMPHEFLTPSAENRAREVQALLADRGQHRAASVPDLLLAAIAERARLTVLHVDKDFELIASVTGQPIERLRLAATQED